MYLPLLYCYPFPSLRPFDGFPPLPVYLPLIYCYSLPLLHPFWWLTTYFWASSTHILLSSSTHTSFLMVNHLYLCILSLPLTVVLSRLIFSWTRFAWLALVQWLPLPKPSCFCLDSFAGLSVLLLPGLRFGRWPFCLIVAACFGWRLFPDRLGAISVCGESGDR